ncbi:GTPase IMAP family member 1-like [Poecilia latipinna]|uniref:GTPase IMAP family member 1-like n=1 Tax=Poecilia latipinna TaxID=48699 RepID=UPI00072EB94D|nr:PREDICTED: GTPase IMAP family member 1-like [Poecilia latipinna]XP_014878936.1 PREDICTED: GTPase IMAP family member 1-like [Poecilia latipinna]
MNGPVNLVLLGMSGTGKSSTGNSILGEKLFLAKSSSKPVTTMCQLGKTMINGLHVRVIDTPDMFDDDMESSVRDKLLKNCTNLCGSHPCVFVLVLQVSRFTDGERDILTKLKKMFGRKVSEQTIILFTHGDDLSRAAMSLKTFLHQCQPDLREIAEMCGGRCVLFENKDSDTGQVEDLIDNVKEVLADNSEASCEVGEKSWWKILQIRVNSK